MKHGLSDIKEYNAWRQMKSRCNNENHKRFKDYGGRGIKVCLEWSESFEKFYEDMGECPEGFSLDRIENDKNYSKENCKWSTPKEQSSNRRSNIIIKDKGSYKTLKNICEEYNLKYDTIRKRIYRGWSISEFIESLKKIPIS